MAVQPIYGGSHMLSWFHILVVLVAVVGLLIGGFWSVRRWRPAYRTRPRWVEWLIRGLCGAGAVAILAGVSYATWRDIQPPADVEAKATPPVMVAVPTQSLADLCEAHPEWSPGKPLAGPTVQVDKVRLIGHVLVLDTANEARVIQAGSFDLWWTGQRSITGQVSLPAGVVNYELTVSKLRVEKDASTGQPCLRPDIYTRTEFREGASNASSGGTHRPGRIPLVLLKTGDGWRVRNQPNGLSLARDVERKRHSCSAALILQLAGRDDPLRRVEAAGLLPESALAEIRPAASETVDNQWLHRRGWRDHDDPPATQFLTRFAPAALLVLLAAALTARALFRRPGWAMLVGLPLAVIFVAAWDWADVRAQGAIAMNPGAPFSVRMGALNRVADTFFFVRTAADLAGRVERDATAPLPLRRLAGLQCRVLVATQQTWIGPLGVSGSGGVTLRYGEDDKAGTVDLRVTVASGRGHSGPLVIAVQRATGPSLLSSEALARLVLSQPGTYRRIVAIDDDLNVTPLGTEADFLEAAAVCRDVPRLRDLPNFQRLVAPLVQQEALRKTGGQ